MRKTPNTLIEQIRGHVDRNPLDTYRKVALLFSVSETTVKRLCRGLRGKDWNKGRKSVTSKPEKLWRFVVKTDDCWLWTGRKLPNGYGTIWYNGKEQGTHRVAYELKFGTIPRGHDIHHRCNVRHCCRPEHLEAVTHRENMKFQHKRLVTGVPVPKQPGVEGPAGLILTPLLVKEPIRLDDLDWGTTSQEGIPTKSAGQRFFIIGYAALRIKIIALSQERALAIGLTVWDPNLLLEVEDAGEPDIPTVKLWLAVSKKSLEAFRSRLKDTLLECSIAPIAPMTSEAPGAVSLDRPAGCHYI